MSNLKSKFISGVIWESIGRFSSLGIQFLVTILIARILTPTEFGVLGLLTIFIALSSILLDSGFSQALIQKKEVTQLDLSSVYYLNIFLGVIIYLIMYFLSPFIADFYDIPDLVLYSRVLFLIIPINSFGLIQNVIIQKELDFKKTAFASLFSSVFSGILGLILAYRGYGIWALVIQQLSLNFSKTLMYIFQRKWIPIFRFSLKVIQGMFGYSINLMLHSLVNIVMKNIYTLFIGKFFSLADVGYYNQANKFEDISASTLTQIVIKVSFPALVQKKDNPSLLKSAYKNIFSSTICIITPLMVLLICIGEDLFSLLLTDKWLPAVPYFKILCVYGMFLPIIQISYNIYKLFGKSKFLLFIDVCRHSLVLGSILFTVNYSVEYMLLGLSLSTIIMAFLNLYYSGKLISLSLLTQLKLLLPYYFVAVIIALLLKYFINGFNGVYFIFLFTICYILLYLLLMTIMNLEGYKSLKDVMFVKFFKKK